MAIVKGPFQLSGSIGNVSFYTRRDSDKVIMRTKGGVSGKKMKRLPQFEGFRNQQKEWSGCTKMASTIRYAFGGLHRLADYNLTPVLNSLTNKMQKAAIGGEKGSRPVLLSNYRQALDGFNFNRKYPFNTVLRVSVNYTMDRETLAATVNFNRINPANDLLNVQNLPYYRLIIALGMVSDMAMSEDMRDYQALAPEIHGISETVESVWFPANSITEALTLSAHFNEPEISAATTQTSLLLSVAIEFGTLGIDGLPAPVKYAGCGKVLKVI